MMRGTGAVAALVMASTVALSAGCTSDHRPRVVASRQPVRVDASVAQFRYAEGTPDLRAGVTNPGERTIRVSSATISWDGFGFPPVRIPDPQTLPGNTAAFTIAYGAPRCGHRPEG